METTIEKRRPGGIISKRESQVFLLCDLSGSMLDDGKITELNNCLREAVPHMKRLEDETPEVEIKISILGFNTKATWIAQNEPIKDFFWKDLNADADGLTNMGEAFSLMAMAMKSPDMPERGYPPLVVLISDGQATDSYKTDLDDYLHTNWGAKSIRYSIAIGKEADHSALQKFINNSELKPIMANNPEQLAKAINFVSTIALKRVSVPTGATPMPAEGGDESEGIDNDVW